MPGYSGTPLPKKLGIKAGHRVRLINAPTEVQSELRELLVQCELAKSGTLDFAMIFAGSHAELIQHFAPAAKMLAPAGMLWVSWHKKSSGIPTDLNENMVRDIGLDGGLVDVKVCAVTDIWSGLKFVRRLKDRSKNQPDSKPKVRKSGF